MTKMTRLGFLIFTPLFLFFLLEGCGRSGEVEIADVSGTVIYDGEAARGLIVIFQPEKYPASMAFTDANGRFKLRYNANSSGAPVGKHAVRIELAQKFAQGDPMQDPGYRELMGSAEPTKIPPAVLKNFSKTVDVEPGNNDFEFTLKSGQ